MTDQHDALGKKKRFCQIRGTPCKCGNHYQNICKPKGKNWSIEFEVGEAGTETQSWEAHHILSVSCVAIMPKSAKAQAAVRRVQKVTNWCINNKGNMIAMPKFGQTIMYYTNVKGDYYYKVGFKSPDFQDIPQHDFEHDTKGGYCTELKKDILNLWNEVAKAEKKHLRSKNGVKSQLEELSRKWKKKLNERGKRQDGTHASWKMGSDDPDSKWYLPFSMASAAHAQTRYFNWTDKINDKMIQIRKALRFAGKL